LWAPHRQRDTVREIARCYAFSPVLTALMCSSPPRERRGDLQSRRRLARNHHFKSKEDLEEGLGMSELPPEDDHNSFAVSHYIAARHMINYQTDDVGARCRCLFPYEPLSRLPMLNPC